MALHSCVGAGKFRQLEANRSQLEEDSNLKIKALSDDLDLVKNSEQHLRDEQIKQNTLLSSLLADKLNQEKEIRSLQAKINRMTDASESAQAVLNKELQAKNESLQSKEAILNELMERFQQQQSVLQDISSHFSQELSNYSEDQLDWYLIDQQLDVVLYNSFLFDKSHRLTPSSLEVLNKLSSVIVENPSLSVVIEGHTNNDLNTEATALETSALNASKLARFFLNEGRVNSNQIQVAGKGGFSPRVSNQTPAGRQLNNRVEVQLQLSSKEIFRLIKDQQ